MLFQRFSARDPFAKTQAGKPGPLPQLPSRSVRVLADSILVPLKVRRSRRNLTAPSHASDFTMVVAFRNSPSLDHHYLTIGLQANTDLISSGGAPAFSPHQ